MLRVCVGSSQQSINILSTLQSQGLLGMLTCGSGYLNLANLQQRAFFHLTLKLSSRPLSFSL